jgi:hypothetical protein
MFVLMDNFWHFARDPNALVSNLAIGGDWKHILISVALSDDCWRLSSQALIACAQVVCAKKMFDFVWLSE